MYVTLVCVCAYIFHTINHTIHNKGSFFVHTIVNWLGSFPLTYTWVRISWLISIHINIMLCRLRLSKHSCINLQHSLSTCHCADCQDGTIAFYQMTFNTVHSHYKDRCVTHIMYIHVCTYICCTRVYNHINSNMYTEFPHSQLIKLYVIFCV